MSRGGYREKAGRKSGWNHSETQVIRVPKVIAEQLLEVAKRLDRGESLESVSESKVSQVDSDTDSKNDLVTESIKHVLAKWKSRADAASPRNTDWRKARQMLSELEPIIHEGVILDSVAKSKVSPGQMSLLDSLQRDRDQKELVTDSKDSSIEKVTDSTSQSDWLTTRECWEQLGKPGSYDGFRKASPERLKRLYGVDADVDKKKLEKYNVRWLRISDNVTLSNQVNPLPEGSERSGEG